MLSFDPKNVRRGRSSGVVISDRYEPREPNFRDVRVVLKYRHCDGNLCIKVTDDVACLLYRTDQAQDVKKIEKFHSQLMRLMVAKESRSAAMETD
ncbi:signal recognition particle 9 kDa protein [Antrostomus carolinensis]|uniref:signal recognition particle 9 kDa protein n=1 Tax=Antrostomus carolinensis TaxID=279965 RepID=UPI0010A98035|nr:signal recognition particle 9 kDa protein [Antrostomus carolinensis]